MQAVQDRPRSVLPQHSQLLATQATLWGTVVAACLCDALTLGNLLTYDNGVADQAVAASLATRLPEFIRDVRLAVRRGRADEPAYRSVFEQLVTGLRSLA